MTRPAVAFDTPKFALIPDSAARMYANVDNGVQVGAAESFKAKRVPVVVPTGLFTIMKDVFKIDRDELVELYVFKDGEYFVFGIVWGEESIADLWCYTDANLPPMFR